MTTVAEQPIMTAERFAQGMTWGEYFASIQANKPKFEKFYNEFRVNPEEVAWYKKFNAKNGPIKIIAIGEDWCPDVVRGIPVIARLAEALDVELRIFPRDSHMDLMNRYLWRHEYLSVPVFVFFDKNWKELGHWTERPAAGYKFVAEIREELAQSNTSEEESLKVIRAKREGAQEVWMHETIKEIREQILTRVM
ncbi:MAG: thioredoxin family protein [Dehalococcoidia bacterium]|nr:thioredoxin family protein [Dehalococcoidia bacterium]